MTLFDFSSAFFILCLGISVSALVFLLELIFKRLKLYHFYSSSNNFNCIGNLARVVGIIVILPAIKETNNFPPNSESNDIIKISLNDPTIKVSNIETMVVAPIEEKIILPLIVCNNDVTQTSFNSSSMGQTTVERNLATTDNLIVTEKKLTIQTQI